MTIHRIHNDDSYLIYTMDTSDVIAKLGRVNLFHLDPSPLPYAKIWKEPLILDFGPLEGETKHHVVPNLAVRGGRMFFDEQAYTLLRTALAQDGEFLPVVYADGTGYIFNPLVVAEKSLAVDDKVTVHNEWGEIESLGIIEEKLPPDTRVFKCEATKYAGVFCTDEFKQAVESAGLVGVSFHPDLANAGGGATPEH